MVSETSPPTGDAFDADHVDGIDGVLHEACPPLAVSEARRRSP